MLSLPAAGSKSFSTLISWPFLFWHNSSKPYRIVSSYKGCCQNTSKEHSQEMSILMAAAYFISTMDLLLLLDST